VGGPEASAKSRVSVSWVGGAEEDEGSGGVTGVAAQGGGDVAVAVCAPDLRPLRPPRAGLGGDQQPAQRRRADDRRRCRWTPHGVLDVLRNPPTSDGCPSTARRTRRNTGLVDQATFERAQTVMAQRGESWQARAANAGDYLPTSLLRRQRLRPRIRRHRRARPGRHLPLYTCYAHQRQGTARCDQERIPPTSWRTRSWPRRWPRWTTASCSPKPPGGSSTPGRRPIPAGRPTSTNPLIRALRTQLVPRVLPLAAPARIRS
jgi:hypothetical protein